MHKKKELIGVVLLIIILFIVFSVLFNGIFVSGFIVNKIFFFNYNNYQNRSDILTFLNIIIACVSSTISIIISLLIYKLSKEIEKKNALIDYKDRYKNMCTTYDYLIEIIEHIKRKVFMEKENYKVLDYRKDFIENIYSLYNDVFDDDDIEYLRKLNNDLKSYIKNEETALNAKDPKKLVIKLLYKDLFDLNIDINTINEINLSQETEIILNLQLVKILTELREKLKNKKEKIECNYKEIKLNVRYNKGNLIIEKSYDLEHYILNGEGNIAIYEPVFYLDGYSDGGIIYDGSVKNYKCEGQGMYFYKTTRISGPLDSNNLVDKNAQKITKELEKNKIDTHLEATFEGDFHLGLINKGTVIYTKEGKETYIEI